MEHDHRPDHGSARHSVLLSRVLFLLVAVLVVSCKPADDGAESTAPAVADRATTTAPEETPSERDPRHNVLLISVDTLRADHLSLYRLSAANHPGHRPFLRHRRGLRPGLLA